jgi:hypothetical protein
VAANDKGPVKQDCFSPIHHYNARTDMHRLYIGPPSAARVDRTGPARIEPAPDRPPIGIELKPSVPDWES